MAHQRQTSGAEVVFPPAYRRDDSIAWEGGPGPNGEVIDPDDALWRLKTRVSLEYVWDGDGECPLYGGREVELLSVITLADAPADEPNDALTTFAEASDTAHMTGWDSRDYAPPGHLASMLEPMDDAALGYCWTICVLLNGLRNQEHLGRESHGSVELGVLPDTRCRGPKGAVVAWANQLTAIGHLLGYLEEVHIYEVRAEVAYLDNDGERQVRLVNSSHEINQNHSIA